MSSQLLACDYYAHAGTAGFGGKVHACELALNRSLRSLPQCLLTHDTIFIPTDYYPNLLVITHRLGVHMTRHLIESGAIKFCRFRRMSGYMPLRRDISNPGEFCEISVAFKDDHPTNWATDRAAEFITKQIRDVCADTFPKELIINSTADVDQINPAESVGRKIEDAIRKNPELQTWINSATEFSRHMRKVELGNTVMFHNSVAQEWLSNPWMRILLIYHSQLDLHLQNVLDIRDMRAAASVRTPFSASSQPEGMSQLAFDEICEMLSLPDFSGMDLSGKDFRKLVKLREASDASKFRQWLSSAASGETGDLSEIRKEFTSLLLHQSWAQRLDAVTLRYLFTTAAGSIPLLGPLVSAADSFLIDRLVGRNGARIFVNKLRSFKPYGKLK